jgi:hypothetical protein
MVKTPIPDWMREGLERWIVLDGEAGAGG